MTITLILCIFTVADAAVTSIEPQDGGGSAAIFCPNSTLPVQIETFHTYAAIAIAILDY